MNDDTKTKRRLPIVSDAAESEAPEKELMPEVLPRPTRNDGGSSARQRTLERMATLMAVAVASSALGAKCDPRATNGEPDASANSQQGYAVVDPAPPPAIVDAGAPTADVAGPLPPPPGYGVVDPMPSPPIRSRRRR